MPPASRRPWLGHRPSLLAALLAALLAWLVLGGACGDRSSQPQSPGVGSQAAFGYPELPLAEAMDQDPRAGEVAVDLVARAAPVPVSGATPTLWTYAIPDGAPRIPGPLIRARVGDRLVVRFSNQLPEPTTIHWHGMRVPHAMDGAHVSQQPILPGASFEYAFVLPDAGLFWFHPHHRSSRQVAAGLYAPVLVEDPAEVRGLGRNVVLVLSDLALGPDGTLAPDDGGDVAATMLGRQGDLVLVNGQERPTVKVVAGSRQRWRLLNAARSRFMRIAIPGVKLQLLGGDGGLMEQALPPHDQLLLTPGERADLSLVPEGAVGARLPVRLSPHDRGGGESPERDLFYLELGAGDPVDAGPLPAKLRTIERLLATPDAPRQVIRIGARADGFVVNEVPGQAEGHVHTAAFRARVGETHVLSVTNHTRFDHPFHLHGFFFQEMDPSGRRPLEPVQWKDTINLPALSASSLAVLFDDRPGLWMFHCHILDHAERGLTGLIDLLR